jgi:uncharacterized protein (TIGR02271 family)
MAQTVIGMFDDAADAQRAVEKLTDKGFSRNNIDVTNRGSSSSSDTNADTGDEHESGIGRFFRNLFSDDDDSDKYVHVARHSKSIVTVHAQDADEAEQAADILDDAGAVDVDERAASYGYTGQSRSNFNADNSVNNLSGSSRNTGDYTGTTSDLTGTTSNDSSLAGGFAGTTAGIGTTGNNFADLSNDTVGDRSDNINRSTDQTTKIPIIEENLEVGKREVRTGGARLRSRIVERPVEESLRLREENVTVERNPVDRAATEADLKHFGEKEIEMTETAEVPVVSKEARVVEEVSLNKEVNERTETVSDTVRKTEVDVENLKADRNSDRTDYNTSDDSSRSL